MNPRQQKIAIGVVVILVIIVIIGIIITQHKPPLDDSPPRVTTGGTTEGGDDTGGDDTGGDKKQITSQCGPTKGVCPVGYCNDNHQCIKTFQNNEKLWKYNSSQDGTVRFKRDLNIDGVSNPHDGFIFKYIPETKTYRIYDKTGNSDERKCLDIIDHNSTIGLRTCDGNRTTQDWTLKWPGHVASVDQPLPATQDNVNRCLPNSKMDGKFIRSRLTRCDYGWSTYPEINN